MAPARAEGRPEQMPRTADGAMVSRVATPEVVATQARLLEDAYRSQSRLQVSWWAWTKALCSRCGTDP